MFTFSTYLSPLREYRQLTHLPLDKMDDIPADDIFKCIFLNENDRILIQISLKSVPRSPIDNKTVLVQVMAWCRTGDKPLPEPRLTQFTDAYMRHYRGRWVKIFTCRGQGLICTSHPIIWLLMTWQCKKHQQRYWPSYPRLFWFQHIFKHMYQVLCKIASILQMFSNVFSWMKFFAHQFKFHWSLFFMVQLVTSRFWSVNVACVSRASAHIPFSVVVVPVGSTRNAMASLAVWSLMPASGVNSALDRPDQ